MALLSASGLRKRLGGRQVVDDVSFAVGAGEIVGLLGPNGAGKTTCFGLVAGLTRLDAGSVRLDGIELGRMPLYRRARRGLGYLPQEPTVFRGLTVRENLSAAAAGGAVAPGRVERLLAEFNLGQLAGQRGDALSGGERRRLEMARALVRVPRVLLLDEPFAGVDPIAVGEIRGFVAAVRAQGIGVLVTDHNVRETLGICDRAYLICAGRIVLEGSPAALVASPEARRLYLGQDFSP